MLMVRGPSPARCVYRWSQRCNGCDMIKLGCNSYNDHNKIPRTRFNITSHYVLPYPILRISDNILSSTASYSLPSSFFYFINVSCTPLSPYKGLTVICEASSKEQSNLSSLAETFKKKAISDITWEQWKRKKWKEQRDHDAWPVCAT